MDVNGEIGRIESKWAEIKTMKKRMLRELHEKFREAKADREAELTADIIRLLNKGVRKGTIATRASISRSKLDELIQNYSPTGYSSYRFEQHDFGRSVWVRGVLPENGGFPFLQGEMGVRFVFLSGNYRAEPDGITGPEYKGVKEFMTTRYSAEVLAWALENGVVKPEEVKTAESVDTEVSDW